MSEVKVITAEECRRISLERLEEIEEEKRSGFIVILEESITSP